MNNNAALLDTLLQQAETAVQRHSQNSRLNRQAVHRRQERNDAESVARQLDEIYQYRASRLPDWWRIGQQFSLNNKTSW